MNILIGADPELFVFNKKLNELVSAEGMVDGTKEDPLAVTNGAVQVDGMALEFNIDPASTMEEFTRNIQSVKQQLHEMIGAKDYDLLPTPTATFSEDAWWACTHEAKELGCSPDINAWTGEFNRVSYPEGHFRTAAGHVHIGYVDGANPSDKSHVDACIRLTKQLDASLGIQSILWDDDTERRSLYGKAGAFRPKRYGSEYRVLSNVWLKSEELIKHVYNVTHKATQDLMEGIDYVAHFGADSIINVINTSDVDSARLMSKEMGQRYGIAQLA